IFISVGCPNQPQKKKEKKEIELPDWAKEIILPIDKRDFEVGVGLTIKNWPNHNEKDFLETLQRLSEIGGFVGIYNIWYDAPVKAGEIPKAIRDFYGLSLSYDFKPLIALQFFDATTGEPFLSTSQNPINNWTNKDAREKFRRVAVEITERYEPEYLALGVEQNVYYYYHSKDYDNFVSIYKEIYDAIKDVSPKTKVFTIFQLELMTGKSPLKKTEPQWFLIEKFEPKLDLVGFTTYPFILFESIMKPQDIPQNYYLEIENHTSKPLAFTEIGWASIKISSEEEQVDFLLRFLELTKNLKVEVVNWAFLYDVFDSRVDEIMGSVGLIKVTGETKKVWFLWLRISKLSYGWVM
ncbi:MAG: hypothetical protein ACE5HW_05255, partial [Candidatus Methanofastidiosia archaeon]